MKILSITTSSPICGVAILENSTLIKQINLDNGLTHSESLMPIIKQILKETNLTLNDINLLITDIGPGSFTGIRIGISTIKAFVDSLNIPAIGINSLEGLAYNVQTPTIICSLIDAKKENVYAQIFEHIDTDYILRRNASFENINSLLLELKNLDLAYNLTFVGDGSVNYKEKILETLPNSIFSDVNKLSAYNIALAGYHHYIKNDFSTIEPLYLKRTQAEQLLEEKQNDSK